MLTKNEKGALRARKSYLANREKVLAASKARYVARCEMMTASVEAFLDSLTKSLRNSHRKKTSSLTRDDLLTLWYDQNGLCAISGIAMTHQAGNGRIDTNISVDRIDNTQNYVPSNVRLVCHRANLMRGNLRDEELLHWCRTIIAAIGAKVSRPPK